MSKSLIACVEDLFFRSKIEATARHLNVPVRFVAAGGAREGLAERTPRRCSSSSPPTATRSPSSRRCAPLGRRRSCRSSDSSPTSTATSPDEAESAGVTQVMPRSQFSETLPDLIMDLLAPGTKREIQEEPELPDE